jgi:D-alanyl-D-alanine carboxypeptidase
VHPGRPTRRQLRTRQLVAGIVAATVLAAVGMSLIDRGDPADERRAGLTEGAVSTTAASVPTTTTAPSEPTVVTDPLALTVLVNKHWRLPPGWVPPDLAEPDVPFTFSGPDPKRLLRQPAAAALESLFEAAARAGTPLAAVSGYRSEQIQADLYELSVSEQGAAQADLHSARPGHSEHQTGLAMDVTSADGTCAVQDCFGTTAEARWLAAHAAEHGFVVRYPAGKDAVTGYAYEPWHLRFVGVDVATQLAERGLVLEELPG